MTSARPAYILGAVSLFVPILATILIPEMNLRLFIAVSSTSTALAIVALVLGIRVLRRGRSLDGLFGLLLAIVALGYNVPLLVQALQLL